MPFPDPPVTERAYWVQQFQRNLWQALEAMYDKMSSGGASEATLLAFKTANHADLLAVIAAVNQTATEATLASLNSKNTSGGLSTAQLITLTNGLLSINSDGEKISESLKIIYDRLLSGGTSVAEWLEMTQVESGTTTAQWLAILRALLQDSNNGMSVGDSLVDSQTFISAADWLADIYTLQYAACDTSNTQQIIVANNADYNTCINSLNTAIQAYISGSTSCKIGAVNVVYDTVGSVFRACSHVSKWDVNP